MSSFVWNSFWLLAPRTGLEIRKSLWRWISGAKTDPTPPPMCLNDDPDQRYNITLLPFNIDCTYQLQCPCKSTNLWLPTVLLFMLLHHCIVIPFLSHQSMTLYGNPFYAIVPINFNALVTRPIYNTLRYYFLCYCIIILKCFFCPTNLWPSTVLLFMLLYQ